RAGHIGHGHRPRLRQGHRPGRTPDDHRRPRGGDRLPGLGRGCGEVSGLRVRGLQAAYGRTVILTAVDLDVHPGEVVGLAGRNGAGKTTTLRAISGVLPRRAAELLFGEAPLPTSPRNVARLGIAHVPEGRGMLRTLTVEENLRFAAAAVGKAYGRGERDRALAWF